MTENKRFWCLDEYKGETSPIVDGKFAPTNEWLCNELNELYEENQKLKNENQVLKQFINDVFDLLDKNILEAEDMVKWSDEKGLRYTNVSWSFLLKTLKLMKKGMSLEGNLLISDETLE